MTTTTGPEVVVWRVALPRPPSHHDPTSRTLRNCPTITIGSSSDGTLILTGRTPDGEPVHRSIAYHDHTRADTEAVTWTRTLETNGYRIITGPTTLTIPHPPGTDTDTWVTDHILPTLDQLFLHRTAPAGR